MISIALSDLSDKSSAFLFYFAKFFERNPRYPSVFGIARYLIWTLLWQITFNSKITTVCTGSHSNKQMGNTYLSRIDLSNCSIQCIVNNVQYPTICSVQNSTHSTPVCEYRRQKKRNNNNNKKNHFILKCNCIQSESIFCIWRLQIAAETLPFNHICFLCLFCLFACLFFISM